MKHIKLGESLNSVILGINTMDISFLCLKRSLPQLFSPGKLLLSPLVPSSNIMFFNLLPSFLHYLL